MSSEDSPMPTMSQLNDGAVVPRARDEERRALFPRSNIVLRGGQSNGRSSHATAEHSRAFEDVPHRWVPRWPSDEVPAALRELPPATALMGYEPLHEELRRRGMR